VSADFKASGLGAAPEPPTGLRERLLAILREPDTAKAAGLAGAMIANNVIALGSTFVFARLIGDYGSLAALVSYLLILAVVGQAMQVATAREGVLGRLGVKEGMAATLISWTKVMVVCTVGVAIVSILLRHPIADLVGVKHDQWAAAAGLPAASIYLELCLLRGALQGIGDYKHVGLSLIGEQGSRLAIGTVLAVAGLGLTGAYLGSLFSYIVMCGYCTVYLRRQLVPESGRRVAAALSLWVHVKRAWAPIAGLIVVALLQNIDLIAAKHRFDSKTASSYAATAVAAKVVIWVAMGASFYLVPEVSRRRAAGENTRGVLVRALGIIFVCAIPCLLIFAVGAHPLLSIAFSHKRATASSSLLPLGAAFSALAATYLAVQYLLALKRTWFLVAIGAVAAAEPVFLLSAPRHPAGFAGVVLAIQAVGALVAFALALRVRSTPTASDGDPSGIDRVLSTQEPHGDRVAVTAPQ
jgi:O-antigen/teichoic acid export membrane protein